MSEAEHGEEILNHLLGCHLTALMGVADEDGSSELYAVGKPHQVGSAWTLHVMVPCARARQWRLQRPQPMCMMLYSARAFYRAVLSGIACACDRQALQSLQPEQQVCICLWVTQARFYNGADTHVRVRLNGLPERQGQPPASLQATPCGTYGHTN